MSLLGAITIGTGLVRGISSISRGRAQKRLADERAAQKRIQQLEIQRRTESEIDLLRERAAETVGLGIARFAGGGIDVSSGAAVQAEMKSFENLGRSIINKRLEASFRNSQLSAEERWERKQGRAFQASSVIDAFGGLLNTATSLSKVMPSSSAGSSVDILGNTTMDAGFSNTGMEGVV